MKALVTGGAGFIGSNLVPLLCREGWDVRVLDNLSSGYRENLRGVDVEFVERDIRDVDAALAATRGVDAVFHLAASVGNARAFDNPREDSDVNVLGTLALLMAAAKNGVSRFVYSSSAAIFGELQGDVVDEQHPQHPASAYGVSKLAGEKHALCAGMNHAMIVSCLRYFNVYGVHQRYDAYGNVIPIFAHRLLGGRPLTIYGDGQQTRDFVNARDVARVNLLAATYPTSSDVYNVGCGEAITINRLAALMQEVSGIRAPIEYAPKRPGEVLHCRAETSKLQRTLGFAPDPNITAGLGEYLEWFRQDQAARP